MITNSKKEELMVKITNAIYNSGTIYPPHGIDGPIYRELCTAITNNIKITVDSAFRQLLNDLYTQEEFEKDIGLKS
jgi:hypothetical protein